MSGSLVFILAVLTLCCSVGAAAIDGSHRLVACPDAVLISPCTCQLSGQQIDMVCNGLTSLQSLLDIFGRTFPDNNLHSIVISSSRLDVLPNDVFRGKSFEVISFIDNRFVSFENPGVLSSSLARLTSLNIVNDNDEWIFNFANVQSAGLLNELGLAGYAMQLSGTLSSASLNKLLLRSDYFTDLPPGLGQLPALTILDLDGSQLGGLPANSFSNLASLSELYLGHNKIVSLISGAINLVGSTKTVDLSSNLIRTLSPGWIKGISSDTVVQLVNNYISQLDRDSLEDAVKALLPTGKLLLDGNPLVCQCDVAWVMADASYLDVVSDARCVNGTRLVNLDPDYFVQNC